MSFPHYTQLDAMDCGPTSLKIVAQFYGKHYSLRNLRDAALRMILACFGHSWKNTHRLIGAWYAHRAFPEPIVVCPEAEQILAAHREYCRRIGITGTPTVLVDNRRLPAMYDTEDLKILL